MPVKERLIIGVALALAAWVLGNIAYAVWIRTAA